MRALLALCALAIAITSAHAQLPEPPRSPSETDSRRARDAFVQGMELANEARFADALEEFLRSYELSGSPVALFNVASTLRTLGRVREAQEAFDRLLALGDLDDTMRETASEYRSEVAARVARALVEGVPPGDARVTADGRERDVTASRPIEIALDPGLHGLEVALDGYAPWRWTGELADGARVPLMAEMTRLSSSVLEEPLFWVLVGAVLVAGVVIASVAIDQSLQLGPRTSPVVSLP